MRKQNCAVSKGGFTGEEGTKVEREGKEEEIGGVALNIICPTEYEMQIPASHGILRVIFISKKTIPRKNQEVKRIKRSKKNQEVE